MVYFAHELKGLPCACNGNECRGGESWAENPGRVAVLVAHNKEQAILAFGMPQPTVKKLLHSWGGHNLKIHLRVRKRERQDVPFPSIDCSVAEFAEYMGDQSLLQFRQMHGPRLLKKNIQPYLRMLHRQWKLDNPSIRVDASIREIESPRWDLLRHPSNFS